MKFEQQPLIPIDFPNDSFSTIGKVSKKTTTKKYMTPLKPAAVMARTLVKSQISKIQK